MPQEITGMSGATHTIRYEYDRDNRLVRVSDYTGAAIREARDRGQGRGADRRGRVKGDALPPMRRGA